MRLGFLILSLALIAANAVACSFCDPRGLPLTAEIKEAELVVLGKFLSAKPGKDFDFESEFKVSEVLKAHPFLAGKDGFTLNAYQASSNPFLLYLNVEKSRLDAYRGVELVGKSALITYLKGAMKLAEAPPAARLRYAFEHLQSDDPEVSLDAYRAFAVAPYADYKDMARSLPPDAIAAWIQNPKTGAYRYGLYASLLGHAGAKEPAKYGKVLRDMIDEPARRAGARVDGLLAGYAMLQPAEAVKYLHETLANPKEAFLLRYACLRAVRFFWEHRPDVLSEKDILHALVLVARTPDMADIGIGDLRRYNRWDAAPAVFDLFARESHDTRLIKDAILRYALHARAQGVTPAAEFLARHDPGAVRTLSKELERGEDLTKPWERGATPAKTKPPTKSRAGDREADAPVDPTVSSPPDTQAPSTLADVVIILALVFAGSLWLAASRRA